MDIYMQFMLCSKTPIDHWPSIYKQGIWIWVCILITVTGNTAETTIPSNNTVHCSSSISLPGGPHREIIAFFFTTPKKTTMWWRYSSRADALRASRYFFFSPAFLGRFLFIFSGTGTRYTILAGELKIEFSCVLSRLSLCRRIFDSSHFHRHCSGYLACTFGFVKFYNCSGSVSFFLEAIIAQHVLVGRRWDQAAMQSVWKLFVDMQLLNGNENEGPTGLFRLPLLYRCANNHALDVNMMEWNSSMGIDFVRYVPCNGST